MSYNPHEWAEEQAWKKRHAEVLAKIAEGEKLSDKELYHWVEYNEARLSKAGNRFNVWRHKKSEALYNLHSEPVTLDVTTDNVVTLVAYTLRSSGNYYTPIFARQIDDFLDKFEPVREKTVWEKAS